MLVYFPNIRPRGFPQCFPSTTNAAGCSLSCWQPRRINQTQRACFTCVVYPFNAVYYTTHFRPLSYDKYDCERSVARQENVWSIDGLYDTYDYGDISGNRKFKYLGSYFVTIRTMGSTYRVIQDERSIFWQVIVSVTVRKKVHINMCLILIGYRDRAIWISRPNTVSHLFVGLDEERSLQNKDAYKRRIARSYFGCCCLHKETWRSTETKNTRSSHTSCKVHWGWRWDFGTFIVNCNKFVISV